MFEGPMQIFGSAAHCSSSDNTNESLIDSNNVQCSLPPTCNSEIYCHGKLLHTVQMMRIFEDSKTFVDLKMKTQPDEILKEFDKLLNTTNGNPNRNDVKHFLEDYFESGNELEDWFPPDFVVEPNFLEKIVDVQLKCFARELVALWPFLARKINQSVIDHPNLYSLVPLKNGFIIPGGRFKEIYYWDTYWIIKGLLISEMYDTCRGMLNNLLSLVRDYGFVPNGARVYYLQRSQPPLLTAAAHQYIQFTNDIDWLKDNIELLEKELHFWIKERTTQVTVNGETYLLAHYNAGSSGPRPESYLEDMLVTQNLTEIDREKTFIEIKSGAESGWDFSSRWFVSDSGDNNATLSKISTRQIIPVDLNAILCGAFKIMASFFAKLNNNNREKFWTKYSELWQDAIDRVLWSDDEGIWLDYDIVSKKHRNYFYLSNVAPLWTNCIGSEAIRLKSKTSVISYLEKLKVLDFPGGIPTSLFNTGQQWDAPNAWAPLQGILIQAIENLNTEEGSNLALKLANKWVNANWIGFRETNEMFEKYSSEDPGKYGNGGEYIVQAGFGWTNGVALELINRYADRLQLV